MKNVGKLLLLILLLTGCYATQFDIRNSYCYYYVGEYYENVGDNKQAYLQYKQAFKLNPKFVRAKQGKQRTKLLLKYPKNEHRIHKRTIK